MCEFMFVLILMGNRAQSYIGCATTFPDRKTTYNFRSQSIKALHIAIYWSHQFFILCCPPYLYFYHYLRDPLLAV